VPSASPCHGGLAEAHDGGVRELVEDLPRGALRVHVLRLEQLGHERRVEHGLYHVVQHRAVVVHMLHFKAKAWKPVLLLESTMKPGAFKLWANCVQLVQGPRLDGFLGGDGLRAQALLEDVNHLRAQVAHHHGQAHQGRHIVKKMQENSLTRSSFFLTHVGTRDNLGGGLAQREEKGLACSLAPEGLIRDDCPHFALRISLRLRALLC
jgi:hypothetical protein